MKGRASTPASWGLLVAGVIVLILGVLSLYARSHIFDADHFADGAVQAIENEDVRDVASAQITDELIRAEPDLVTAKPLIEVGVAGLIQTGPFKAALRQGAAAANRAVFEGEQDDALVTIANVGVLASQAIASYRPDLARKIPEGFDATLVRIGEGEVATDGVQIAEKVGFLGLVLPPLGLLLLAGSVFAAPDRRRHVIRAAAGVAVGALSMLVVLEVVKEVLAAGVNGDGDRAAFDSIWDVFLGPLRNWFLILGAFAVVIASAASSALQGHTLGGPIRAAWTEVSTEPETTRGRVIWALVVLTAGLVMVLDPHLVVNAAVVVAGAYLISLATSTLIGVISEPATRQQAKDERRRILRAVLGGVAAAAIVAAVAIALIATGDDEASTAAAADQGCNGSPSLCDRPLDKVAFAATHNSYAGATYPGFLFPEQDTTIPVQLADGIRGLWIDTYYGIPGRRVYTDTSKLDPALIAQVNESMGPKFAAAGSRLRNQLAKPPASAKPEIYLCHGFCELGAVSAEETFKDIATFMKENPNEVLIIDIEDYTTPQDTQALIESTGLADYVYKGAQGPPWPTLQEMIDSGGRILLVSEHQSGGASWYRPLNSTIQETPFDFKAPAKMTCKGGRGDRSTTLFLINNWISTDPTPFPSNAKKVNAHKFLLGRARKCERQRKNFPNVLNVDFYKQGDLFGVVRELNGVATSPSP